MSRAAALDRRLREEAYLAFHRTTGSEMGAVYRRMRAEDRARSGDRHLSRRLAELLRHAADNVPYYAPVLSGSGGRLEPEPLTVLAAIPPLTKQLVRERSNELRSRDIDAREVYEQTSGGSTGEPLRLLQDARFRAHDLAIQLLMSSWTGWRLAEPEAMILGSERDMLENTVGLRAKAANHLLRRSYFNAFRMSRETMVSCLEELDRARPRLIRAYAQSISDLAAFALEEGISVAPQNAVLSTAGTLYPFMRERIQAAFRCRVYDQYGSREVSGIACECGQGEGMHVLPWMNYVEVVDEVGQPVEPGVEGRLLVTSLCNYAMPLIRYEIGDRGALMPAGAAPCPCGRGGQRLAWLAGRIVDTFRALDGTLVNGEYFTHLLYFRDWLRRFQVVQTEPATVVFRLVLTAPLPARDREEIVEGTRRAMGEACQVWFEPVEEIKPTPSGKHRFTIREC